MQPQVPEDMREMVLDAESDEFFRTHASLTFGEVGMSVKALVGQYQAKEAQHKQVCCEAGCAWACVWLRMRVCVWLCVWECGYTCARVSM